MPKTAISEMRARIKAVHTSKGVKPKTLSVDGGFYDRLRLEINTLGRLHKAMKRMDQPNSLFLDGVEIVNQDELIKFPIPTI